MRTAKENWAQTQSCESSFHRYVEVVTVHAGLNSLQLESLGTHLYQRTRARIYFTTSPFHKYKLLRPRTHTGQEVRMHTASWLRKIQLYGNTCIVTRFAPTSPKHHHQQSYTPTAPTLRTSSMDIICTVHHKLSLVPSTESKTQHASSLASRRPPQPHPTGQARAERARPIEALRRTGRREGEPSCNLPPHRIRRGLLL